MKIRKLQIKKFYNIWHRKISQGMPDQVSIFYQKRRHYKNPLFETILRAEASLIPFRIKLERFSLFVASILV
jgi:hypothetical protein